MNKLQIIDDINKDKSKRFIQIDKELFQGEAYIGYTNNPRTYIRIADNGLSQIEKRIFPIFQGFIDGKGTNILITGKRGTGKTIFANAIATDYHKLNPKNKIYYIYFYFLSESQLIHQKSCLYLIPFSHFLGGQR